MSVNSAKGAKITIEKSIQKSMNHFLKKSMKDGVFDAALLPMKVPSGDSYAWILMKDEALIDDANPMAPVMPVQGAKALKSLTRKGKGKMKIAVVMRPCEIRAAVELSKLSQVRLDRITLISYDCPGALPLSDFNDDPEKVKNNFNLSLKIEIHRYLSVLTYTGKT